MSLRGSAGCWEESGSPCPPPGPGRPAPLALGADSHSTESQCDASLRTNSHGPLELFLWDPRGRAPGPQTRVCRASVFIGAGGGGWVSPGSPPPRRTALQTEDGGAWQWAALSLPEIQDSRLPSCCGPRILQPAFPQVGLERFPARGPSAPGLPLSRCDPRLASSSLGLAPPCEGGAPSCQHTS